MPPRHTHGFEPGRDFRGRDVSHERSVSFSQDDSTKEIGVTEETQDNPWASESEGDRPKTTPSNQGHSKDRARKGRSPSHDTDFRSSRRYGTTQLRQREPAKPRHQSSPDKDSSYSDRFEASTENETSEAGSYSTEHPDHSDLKRRIQCLQRELASLQHGDIDPHGPRERPASPTPWTVLHGVRCLHTEHVAYYLDAPEVENDQDLRHFHWQGNKRLVHLKAWKRKHNQPFIVHRTYRCADDWEELSEPSEKVTILSRELDLAISSWLDSSSGSAIYDRDGVYDHHELIGPYLCFYHFQNEARQSLSASGIVSQDAQLLLDYLSASTTPIAQEAEAMFASGKVTARLMPYLFKPGALVCFEESGDLVVCEQVSLLTMLPDEPKEGDLQHTVFQLSTVRIAFDGIFRRLRPYRHLMDFRAMGDEPLSIADLSVHPLSSIPSERQAELKRRGDTFMRCQEQLYVTYPSKEEHQDFVDTRFMVDVKAYHMLHDKEASQASDRGVPINRATIDSLESTEEFRLQLPPTIEGFNMTEKKWIHLQVSEIKEVEWSPQTFHSVEIEPESKELIEALVRNKIEREEGIDFVRGKGTGLVVLLHGGPGTGKTLTAEGVAEIAKKPLYRVTGGDVGTDPRAVERYLESVFYLGRRWNCVVLLDEADVFLEQRSFANLERNALVSVFLRVIEYYDGILILTSNRVGTFDEAFKSRIQLALHFDNLNADRRAKIWAKFIDRLAELNENVDFDDVRSHLEALARPPMNGRQIRNAVTTARQLARFRKAELNYTHLKQAIGVSQKFENYVRDVKGGQDDDEIAEQDMLRVRGK